MTDRHTYAYAYAYIWHTTQIAHMRPFLVGGGIFAFFGILLQNGGVFLPFWKTTRICTRPLLSISERSLILLCYFWFSQCCSESCPSWALEMQRLICGCSVIVTLPSSDRSWISPHGQCQTRLALATRLIATAKHWMFWAFHDPTWFFAIYSQPIGMELTPVLLSPRRSDGCNPFLRESTSRLLIPHARTRERRQAMSECSARSGTMLYSPCSDGPVWIWERDACLLCSLFGRMGLRGNLALLLRTLLTQVTTRRSVYYLEYHFIYVTCHWF